MKTELTLNVLQTMSAQEYEDIRAAGSDERRELTHAVMRELDAPDNWMMNGEYGSEFGGFFPVQVRFTPAHERFHLALCSPGDVSQVWVLVLVNAGGEPFAVVQVQRRFAPEAVSHSLALAASLDAQGYTSRRGRQSRKPVRTRRWSLRLKSNWHSIRRKQSEAGMHAGVTGWQSMTWKPCSGSGASVFRHWPEWNAGSGRICHSGRSSQRLVWRQGWSVMLFVRWSGGWCRTNSGRQRDAATITRISRERSE